MTNFAKTQEELAAALGVTRKTIGNCLRHFKSSRPPVPTTRADGRYDITAWQNFFQAHNIKGLGEPEEEPSPDQPGEPSTPRSQSEWKAEKVRLECQRIALNNRKLEGNLVEVSELEPQIGAMLAAFRTAANNLPGRATPKLVGLRDSYEVEDILKAEVAMMLRTLEACPFLSPSEPA